MIYKLHLIRVGEYNHEEISVFERSSKKETKDKRFLWFRWKTKEKYWEPEEYFICFAKKQARNITRGIRGVFKLISHHTDDNGNFWTHTHLKFENHLSEEAFSVVN